MNRLYDMFRKLTQDRPFRSINDILRYYPLGKLNSDITTPDDVQLSLSGLSPITIGRYRSGDSEKPERELIPLAPKEMPIVEIGAGVGYLTTLFNRKTDKTHLAIEPNPNVFPLLVKTKELNNASFTPINAAYHPNKSEIDFPNTRFFKTATFGTKTKSTVEVPTVNLRKLFEEYEINDCLLHVDIEGSESLMFENELDIINEHCSAIFVELHTQKIENLDKYLKKIRKFFKEIAESGSQETPVKLYKKEKCKKYL